MRSNNQLNFHLTNFPFDLGKLIALMKRSHLRFCFPTGTEQLQFSKHSDKPRITRPNQISTLTKSRCRLLIIDLFGLTTRCFDVQCNKRRKTKAASQIASSFLHHILTANVIPVQDINHLPTPTTRIITKFITNHKAGRKTLHSCEEEAIKRMTVYSAAL